MEIGITKTLAGKLRKIVLSAPKEEDLFFCWDAHILHYSERQALMLINVKTRFSSLLINLKPEDWEDFESTAREAITSAMRQEGCQDSEIECYFQKADSFTFTKTHGRTSTGVLRLYNRTIEWYEDELEPESRFQHACCARLHKDAFNAPKKLIYPSEYFLLCMEDHGLIGI